MNKKQNTRPATATIANKKRKANQISQSKPQPSPKLNKSPIKDSSKQIKKIPPKGITAQQKSPVTKNVGSGQKSNVKAKVKQSTPQKQKSLTLPSTRSQDSNVDMEDVEEKKEEEKEEKKVEEPKDDFKKKYPNLSDLFKPKVFTNINENGCSKLTNWVEVTIKELLLKVNREEKEKHRKVGEEEACPICMCELYDDLEKKSKQEIESMHEKQMKKEMPIDVVIMSKCTDHCFHKDCLVQQMGKSDHLKCAVCSQIYGIQIGQMPKGEMRWNLNKGQKCAGFERYGTWTIHYGFPSGIQANGIPYSGTSRMAFVPDTPEGREVLALLVKAFERRHSFIVGTSVTTGQQNCVVWSGIHHKTNTHGGSAHFGYPDQTYFNRVKLELADRGILLESQDEVDRVIKSGKGQIRVP